MIVFIGLAAIIVITSTSCTCLLILYLKQKKRNSRGYRNSNSKQSLQYNGMISSCHHYHQVLEPLKGQIIRERVEDLGYGLKSYLSPTPREQNESDPTNRQPIPSLRFPLKFEFRYATGSKVLMIMIYFRPSSIDPGLPQALHGVNQGSRPAWGSRRPAAP